jgi:hypothetical protein
MLKSFLRKYKLMRKYKKYAIMKKEGKTACEIYLSAKTDGLDSAQRFKILWFVCGLSPADAKEVMVCADTGAKSLSEYQERYILPALKEVFEQEKKDSAQNKDTPPKQ